MPELLVPRKLTRINLDTGDVEVIKTITVDLETTGLDFQKDDILLIAFRINATGPVTVIDWRNTLAHIEDIQFLKKVLSDRSVVVRGHNVKFDALFLQHNGFDIAGPLDDTRILAYLNVPDEKHGLKHLVMAKLNRDVVTMDDIAVKVRKKNKEAFRESNKYVEINGDFYLVKRLIGYNKADVTNCDDLKGYFPSSEWYTKVEQPVLRSLFLSESRGAQLDIPYLRGLDIEYTNEIAKIDLNFIGINLNSPKQVGERFRLRGHQLELTPTGNVKMDRETLKKLSWGGDGEATLLLRRRILAKLLGTYIKPFIEQADSDGRIHGSFNQAGREDNGESTSEGTVTGRLTSTNPNLQNIPARTPEGKRIRKAFINTPGFKMFDADLKQIEPRILAHFSQSPKLLKAYNDGLDTHAYFGSLIFDKPIDGLSPIERFIGKTSWLATVYGASASKLRLICERNSEVQLGLSDKYFEDVQQRFWLANPEIFRWKQEHLSRARRDGYIRTYGGRVIQVRGLNSRAEYKRSEAERMAINYLIQGSAADCMKLILVEFQKRIVDTGMGHLIACVHDEILGEIKDEFVDEQALDGINDIMCNTIKLRNVPVDTDAKFISSWADKK